MAENVKEKNSSKPIIILLIVVIVLLLAGGIIAAVLLLGEDDGDDLMAARPDETSFAVTLPYELGAVMIDEDSFQKQVDALNNMVEEGYFQLSFKRTAVSYDGENFACSIGNGEMNTYDMYIDIYEDESLENQLYVSSLLRPGTKIDTFTSNKKFAPGDYETVLVLTQVEDDHATIHGQSMVYLTLHVE